MSGYHFTIFSLIMLAACISALTVAFVIYRRARASSAAKYLAVMELTVAQWALAYVFETASLTVPLRFLWSKVAYVGTLATPVLFLLFAFHYSGHAAWLTRRRLLFLIMCPVMLFLLAASNSRHYLVWTAVEIEPRILIARYHHGYGFWVILVWGYTVLAVALSLLLGAFHRFTRSYSLGAVMMMVGAVIPLFGNIIYVFDLNPLYTFEWTPIAFMASGGIIAYAVVNMRIFDLTPVARSRLLDVMSEAIMVVDEKGRISDLNSAMEKLLSRSAGALLGRQVADTVETERELCRFINSETNNRNREEAVVRKALSGQPGVSSRPGKRCCLPLVSEKTDCWLEARSFPISLGNGTNFGQLIVLQDITLHRQFEQEREKLVAELKSTVAEVNTLSGLLPICATCKKIRDDTGYWHSVEAYMSSHTALLFSHGICPECIREFYPSDMPEPSGSAPADTAASDSGDDRAGDLSLLPD